MLGTGEAVSHNGREQGIDAAQHPQHRSIHEHQPELPTGEGGHLQGGQLRCERGNRLELCRLKQRHRQNGSQHEGQELGRAELLDSGRCEPEDRNGDQSQEQFHGLDAHQKGREAGERPHHSTGSCLPQKRRQLKDHENRPDP